MIKREWPLTVFSIAVQFACGLALAGFVLDLRSVPAEMAAFRPLGMAIFPVIAAGLLCSLFHLGRPRHAGRALTNVRQSPLSFEILATLIFAGAALAYSGFWTIGREDSRLILSLATAGFGFAAVFAGARLYMVPTQPAWNSGWLPASFLGTALLLGGFAGAVVVTGDLDARRMFLAAGLGGGLLVLVAVVLMARRLGRSAGPLLVACAVLAGILPAVLVVLWPVASAVTPVLIAALALIVVGAVSGRMLIYALMESTPRF